MIRNYNYINNEVRGEIETRACSVKFSLKGPVYVVLKGLNIHFLSEIKPD